MPDPNPPLLDDHDGTVVQLRLDGGKVGEQQPRLLSWAAAGLPVEQHNRRLRCLPRGQQFAEVRVSGHDHPTVLGSVLEDVRIRGVQAQHLADMDRIVNSFA
jgi:hypothetical protein